MTEKVTEEKKSFRFNNQKVLLTYKGWVGKDDYDYWFRETFKTPIKFLRIAHEKADEEDPYEHSHVVVDFGKAFQTRDERKFDYDGVHPNIKFIKSKSHWENAVNYLSKEDADNSDLKKDNRSIVRKVWNSVSQSDALLNNVEKLTDVMGVLHLWENRPMEEEKTTEGAVLRPWQVLCERYFLEMEGRKVKWWMDTVGNVGKSWMVNYLCEKYGNDIMYVIGDGKVADHVYNVMSAVQNGWTGKYMVIDLPRAYEDRNSIYEFIELVKNGRMTNTKYKSKSFCLPNKGKCSVTVFANFVPDVTQMSEDRWSIWEIGKTDVCLLTLKEAKRRRIRITEIDYTDVYMKKSGGR